MVEERDISALFRLTGFELEPRELVVTTTGLSIGRAAENNLSLNHAQLSRQHARIFWKDGQFWIEDLNSSNGAWVNDARIRPSIPQQLRPSDVIRLGPYLLTFLNLATPAPPLPVDPVYRQELPQAEIAAGPEQAVREPPISLDATLPRGGLNALIDLGVVTKDSISPPPPPEPVSHPQDDDGYPVGIPRQRSTWLNYLPAIYADDEFLGRYLLIFESILDPIIWMIDNFDLYLTPDLAPEEWLRWMASWFDLLIIPDLPSDRQRAIVGQLGWLFLRRGTRSGLERLLELYFGVRPEIIENRAEPGHFVVKLPLSESNVRVGREVVEQLIASQKPAFASHTLETT